MASLSEILNSKAEMKQQRTESRRAEREQLSQMRDGALMAITTNPDLYARFLVLQADNIGLSTGNIALSLSQMKDPTKIGTTDFWHKQGRYVMDEEMNKGAAVFVPPRNQNFRGYLMGSYYDVSQTTGRPMKEPEPLAEGSERLNAAFAALLDTAPVGFIENTGLEVPVRYNERECILEINTGYSTLEGIFRPRPLCPFMDGQALHFEFRFPGDPRFSRPLLYAATPRQVVYKRGPRQSRCTYSRAYGSGRCRTVRHTGHSSSCHQRQRI